MTTLRCRGEATTRTTPTCRSRQPPRWRRRRSLTAPATGLHRRRRHTPPPSASYAVIISITLGDLAFLMLRLARGAPPLRGSLVPVEYRLLQERRLGRNKVGALQLQGQEGVKGPPEKKNFEKIDVTAKANKMHQEDNNSQFFLSLHWGASGAATTAATSRSTSRSPVPRGAGPRAVTGATTRSRSPSRGAGWSSSRRGEATRLLRHDTARSLLPR
jgi:hypothetical protein